MKTTIRHILSTLAFAAISATAQAQIGYQVSLLNTATGEPRANVTVNAQVTITDSQNNTIYSGSQQATTNDFGVLSLAVGDASTFANADTGKMPFFISVSVDGTLRSLAAARFSTCRWRKWQTNSNHHSRRRTWWERGDTTLLVISRIISRSILTEHSHTAPTTKFPVSLVAKA